MSLTSHSPRELAFCITDLDPGGAERALVRIVCGLDRSRWSPKVYCLMGRGELGDVLEPAGIPVECLGVRRRFDVGAVGRLAASLRQQRPVLLQTFLYHANIVGRLAAWRARVPRCVAGIRVAERRSRVRLWVDRVTEGLVDRHVCVSRSVAEFSTRAGLSSKKVVVIPNGVDFDRFANVPPADLATCGIPHGSQAIISVARLDPQKGIDVLIEAFSGLAPQWPEAHLLLVGDGPARAVLETQAARSPAATRIHFAGYRTDAGSLVKAATVFVLASRWEGMSNAVLEAMAGGCPVITTRVEGAEELIEQAETGWLVEPENPRQLEQALETILSNPDAAREAAHKAQQRVQSQFTWDRVIAEYDRLYWELTESDRLVGELNSF